MESNEEQNVTLMLIYFWKYELTIASRKNRRERKENVFLRKRPFTMEIVRMNVKKNKTTMKKKHFL